MKLEKGKLKDFFNAPFNAYGKNTNYVSPFKADIKRFISDKNPLFETREDFEIFTVKTDKPIGRIIVHHHKKSNKKLNENIAYIGYFDCANDYEVAKLLLDAATNWAKEKGFDTILSNFNLTAMQQLGVVTDGFENEPYLEQIYNPAHIPEFLTKHGFTKEFPMTTFEMELDKVDAKANFLGPKQEALLQNKEYSFENVTKKNRKKQLQEIFHLLNNGFADNPMFIPLTEEEFYFQAKDMMLIIDEKISYIAYHNGKPIGTVVTIPDVNPFLKTVRSRLSWKLPFAFYTFKKKNTRAVTTFTSVDMDYQNKGVMGVLGYSMITALQENGYKTLGTTWIADINTPSLRQNEKLGGKPHHKTHIFRKVV